ncbi:hypothetical protein D9758_016016 [Tetrapyrgos nigripes]|uniref:RNI-like protein n=1 Tax=Tetrapyrgos nigripes TaxID=182062 RepID=A0A8H5CKE5_9AGAR|nr:hypothetical protein D9758_016016 [Tetrapyrgos nigripes]
MSSSSVTSVSSSPSSSAVTIPIPGKSILKKPPPPQQSLFSRITRFLPQSSGAAGGNGSGSNNVNDEGKPLKRAHFILPEIAVVYPISNLNPPSMPTLKEEMRAIEEREYERRRKVVGGSSDTTYWTLDKVESFYRECCAGCDERPDPAISAALLSARPTDPVAVDFSGVQLTPASAGILADVFTIEWGLRKLVFRECDLDELTLKPILHSLLIPNSLAFLSVASNRRIKLPAFRLVAAFVYRSTSLQFLDLSQIPIDKKSAELLVAALTPAGHPGLASLRLDDCALKPGALEVFAKVVRTSSLKNISLRHNKINQTGAIALSVMIRDYPDAVPMTGLGLGLTADSSSNSSSSGSTLVASPRGSSPSSSLTSSPASSVLSLPLVGSGSGTPTGSTQTHTPPSHPYLHPTPSQPQTQSNHLPPPPPPRHPGTQPTQPAPAMATTYTPYVPRARRGVHVPPPLASSSSAPHSQPHPRSPSTLTHNVPIITTSSQGGVTTATAPTVVNGRNTTTSSSVSSTGMSSFQRKLNASLSGMGITIGSSSNSGSGLDSSSSSGRSTPLSATSPIQTSRPYPHPPVSASIKHPYPHPTSTLHHTSMNNKLLPSHPSQHPAQPTTQHSQPHIKTHQPSQASLPSLALLDKVRALDALPRLGSLRTLDLRGNDLRLGGIGYLGQVLKRNRTLKVLNLSENKIDAQGLVVIAEGLKYNGSLETLDLSRNPIGGGVGSGTGTGTGGMSGHGAGAGGGLEGIHALRTSFTLNTSLKRLFLSSCSINSAGAICLAEFLPESRSLLHLDLTMNDLGVAGVMALNEGLKKNKVMRCLDVEVPPGDEGYARLCREILNTCIRNTEEAERLAQAAAEGDTETEAEGENEEPNDSPSTLPLQTGTDTPGSSSTPVSASSPLPSQSSTPGISSSSSHPRSLSTKSSQSSLSTTSSTGSKTTPGSTPTGKAKPKAKSKALWGMIEDSELAKAIGLQDALADAMRSRSPSSGSVGGNEDDGLGSLGSSGLADMDKYVVARARKNIRLMKEVVEKGGFEGVVSALGDTQPLEDNQKEKVGAAGESELFSVSPFSPTIAEPRLGSSSSRLSLSWGFNSSTTFTSRPCTPIPANPDDLVKRIKGIVDEMTALIERVVEGAANSSGETQGVRVEELLDINDEMMGLLGKVEGLLVLEKEKWAKEKERKAEAASQESSQSPHVEDESCSDTSSSDPNIKAPRPTLKLQGLGIRLDDGEVGEQKEKEKEDKLPSIANGYLHPRSGSSSSSSSSSLGDIDESEDEEPSPNTPRVDKGKGRAPPEPIQHERVLSPTSVLMMNTMPPEMDEEEENEEENRFPRFYGDDAEAEGEGEREEYEEDEAGNEQTERSKSWVQEEGEVFRKGNILLGPEEMEGEYAGEELRRELLEAMVERPAPRDLTDEFGQAILADPAQDGFYIPSAPEPLPSISSSGSTTPIGTPTTEKPPPRPYIPRSRSASSSSSIMSLVSPSPELVSPVGMPLASVPEGQAGLTSSPVTGPITPRPYVSRKRSTSSLDSQK